MEFGDDHKVTGLLCKYNNNNPLTACLQLYGTFQPLLKISLASSIKVSATGMRYFARSNFSMSIVHN